MTDTAVFTGLATDPERAFRHIEALTALGPRVAGSAEEAAGIDHCVEAFARAGLSAETPGFPILQWLDEEVHVAAGGRRLEVTGVPFSGVLDPGTHRLEIAFLESASRFDLERAGDVAGKAWLMSRDAYVDYPDSALAERIAPYRPAMLIFTAAPGHVGVPTVYFNFRDRGRTAPPPAVVMAHRDVAWLASGAADAIEASFRARIGPGWSRNVVAEIAGTERPDEIVVVCAHHDSARTSPGAVDNAGGAAVVIELAQALRASGLRPRRTVHFAIWGSHETGMHGSEAYIRDAIAAGRNVVGAINLDGIGMSVGQDSVAILGGPRWEAAMRATIDGTGIEPSITTGPGFTDFTNFGAAGIPSTSICQAYLSYNHTPGDAVGNCSPRGLVKPLAMAAALLDATIGAADCRPDFPSALRDVTRSANGRWGWSNFTPFDAETADTPVEAVSR